MAAGWCSVSSVRRAVRQRCQSQVGAVWVAPTCLARRRLIFIPDRRPLEDLEVGTAFDLCKSCLPVKGHTRGGGSVRDPDVGAVMGGGIDLVDHCKGEVGTGDSGPAILVKQRDLVPDPLLTGALPGGPGAVGPGRTDKQPVEIARGVLYQQGACGITFERVIAEQLRNSSSANRGAPGAGRRELNPPIWRYLAPASAHSRACPELYRSVSLEGGAVR